MNGRHDLGIYISSNCNLDPEKNRSSTGAMLCQLSYEAAIHFMDLINWWVPSAREMNELMDMCAYENDLSLELHCRS